MPFPPQLKMPAVTAASLTFPDFLTARDLGRLVAVTWYAATHGLADDGTCDVPDVDLRDALGGIRRLGLERDMAAFERLGRAGIASDTIPDLIEPVAVPTLKEDVRRKYIQGARRWTVAPELLEAFQVDGEEREIAFPTSVLASARSRYTIPIFMKLLAWQAGEVPKSWVLKRDERGMRLRVPIADIVAEFGSTLGKPVDVYKYVLLPAATDIAAGSDLMVDFELVRAPSIRAKQMGKCRFVDITMSGVVRHKPHARSRVAVPTNRFGGPVNQPGVVPIRVPLAGARRPTRTVGKPNDDFDVPF